MSEFDTGHEMDALDRMDRMDRIDRLMDESTRMLAGADVPLDLEARLKMRSFAMHTVSPMRPAFAVPSAAVPALAVRPVLMFGVLNRASARDQRSFFGAALLHAAALALIAIGVHAATRTPVLTKPMDVSLIMPPSVTPPLPARTTASAGGGGHTGPAPVTHGNPPRLAPLQLVRPDEPRVSQPKLAADPTVNVPLDLKMARTEVPQFGSATSPLVGMSLGNGRGTGIGSGTGDGLGPGVGGGTGGGLFKIGGSVSAPVVVFAPEAEFSEEARKAKVGGNVLVYLEVDTAGRPVHVRVLHGIGLGLDEQALAAVRKYRFKPAMEAGRPVPVPMTVEVNFTIF